MERLGTSVLQYHSDLYRRAQRCFQMEMALSPPSGSKSHGCTFITAVLLNTTGHTVRLTVWFLKAALKAAVKSRGDGTATNIKSIYFRK